MISLWLTGIAFPAWAVQYRLQVVSLYEEAFSFFLRSGEFANGASGPGLDRLEAAMDRGEVPRGVLLYDRPLQPVSEGIARAYGGNPVGGEMRRGGAERGLWDEVRWEGKPGDQSVWIVAPNTPRTQELFRVALKGHGPLRQFQPYPPANSPKVSAVSFPLNFLWAEEERGTAWHKYVSRALDLGDGIGAVVALNHNPVFADHVYLIVKQGDEPTTYKAVLVWRRRNVDRGNLESAGNGADRR